MVLGRYRAESRSAAVLCVRETNFASKSTVQESDKSVKSSVCVTWRERSDLPHFVVAGYVGQTVSVTDQSGYVCFLCCASVTIRIFRLSTVQDEVKGCRDVEVGQPSQDIPEWYLKDE